MKLENLLEELKIKKEDYKDLHITRFFSAFVAISEGKVISVGDPFLEYCPLADSLCDNFCDSIKDAEIETKKKEIKKAVERKISDFGYFTSKRELHKDNIAIPYGASEMIMYALQNYEIDAAVVVCDGAGTVVTENPAAVQGIGARMNGLFYTSPIEKVIKKLEKENCFVVFPETAEINQIKGLETAAKLGYKNIAVTINGCMEDDLRKLRKVSYRCDVSATTLMVCNTGADEDRIEEIEGHADLVWSCASGKIRESGKNAILQVTTAIPVFVFTKKGLDFISSYSSNICLIRNLDPNKQYIISGRYREGQRIRMGIFDTFLSEAKLPVRIDKEPKPLDGFYCWSEG